ncbi:MAG: ABC transporter ATP-binding protein [Chthoniobacterales bacterium]|nr:ABC transporter ATP-binding protein [Chthoniobacterales bacterium]
MQDKKREAQPRSVYGHTRGGEHHSDTVLRHSSKIFNRLSEPLLEVTDLHIGFSKGNKITPAVCGVSFSLKKGETLAIVGESGSGKSVTALAITRLLSTPPAVYQGGSIRFQGTELLTLSEKELCKFRWGKIAYVFQEASTSLNPVYSIRSQIAESLRLHRPEIKDTDAEIIRWLEIVGITNPETRLKSYPHQLSGGMQQRVMIAMALSAQPDLLIADEPTTALDVTIQAQILTKLQELEQQLGMAMILITHNFSIIRGLAKKVAVMHRGRIVEFGETDQILQNPQHPYTKALIACIPRLDGHLRRLPTIGDHLFE